MEPRSPAGSRCASARTAGRGSSPRSGASLVRWVGSSRPSSPPSQSPTGPGSSCAAPQPAGGRTTTTLGTTRAAGATWLRAATARKPGASARSTPSTNRRSRLSKSRAEAFSDGVFAVAATLLVFSIPTPDSHAALGPALVAQWPSYAAYVISFMTILVIWLNHHATLDAIRSLDRPLLLLNGLVLMTVAVIP